MGADEAGKVTIGDARGLSTSLLASFLGDPPFENRMCLYQNAKAVSVGISVDSVTEPSDRRPGLCVVPTTAQDPVHVPAEYLGLVSGRAARIYLVARRIT